MSLKVRCFSTGCQIGPSVKAKPVPRRSSATASPTTWRKSASRISTDIFSSLPKLPLLRRGSSAESHLPQNELRRLAPGIGERAADAHVIVALQRAHLAGDAALAQQPAILCGMARELLRLRAAIGENER